MKINLNPAEARVLGVLLEKEATTPDAYPLSLNALTAGCNQRSSRDPVMDLAEGEVQAALDGLVKATLAREQGSAGGRVRRYAHRMSTRLFDEYQFSAPERGLLCALLLRGAQTPGELRARTARLHEFADIAEVERTLAGLAGRPDGPHVAELEREPGRRESRWVQLLCEESAAVARAAAPPREETPAVDARIEALERRVERLEEALARLPVQRDGGGR